MNYGKKLIEFKTANQTLALYVILSIPVILFSLVAFVDPATIAFGIFLLLIWGLITGYYVYKQKKKIMVFENAIITKKNVISANRFVAYEWVDKNKVDILLVITILRNNKCFNEKENQCHLKFYIKKSDIEAIDNILNLVINEREQLNEVLDPIDIEKENVKERASKHYIKTVIKVLGLTFLLSIIQIPLVCATSLFLSIRNLFMTPITSEIFFSSSNTVLLIIVADLLAIHVLYVIENNKKKDFRESYSMNTIKKEHFVYLVALTILGICLEIALSTLLRLDQWSPETSKDLQGIVSTKLWLSILGVGVIAPVTEELIYRGAVIKLLKNIAPIPFVIILQAGLFALGHFNLVQALSTFIFGISAGLVFYFTKSLPASIVMHILNNMLVIGLVHFPFDFYLSTFAAAAIVIVSLPAIGLLLLSLHKNCKQEIKTDTLIETAFTNCD